MVACGMIVALMASLGSKFNASATLFTMDFYREWYPNASGKTEVIRGPHRHGGHCVSSASAGCW